MNYMPAKGSNLPADFAAQALCQNCIAATPVALMVSILLAHLVSLGRQRCWSVIPIGHSIQQGRLVVYYSKLPGRNLIDSFKQFTLKKTSEQT
jgi:hypothetical protein